MTTRKLFRALGLGATLVIGGGCATPGPLHVYTLEPTETRPIADYLDRRIAEAPSFLAANETVSGFAYDPFTDHFFLRLAPGNRVRVIDRPARAIKREFEIEGLGPSSGGDLAVRPRDGHIFLLHDDGRAVAEITRLGKLLRVFPLANAPTVAIALALDVENQRLFGLQADRQEIGVYDLNGQKTGTLTLERRVAPSLAFDSAQRRLYAPFAEDQATAGVFDLDGKLQGSLPLSSSATALDVGSRSLIRVF